ncbi:MAG: protocatechuate 3,4-dioxygenase subunit alpha [Sulfurifustaceae bacterium]
MSESERIPATASQTVGPYFRIGLTPLVTTEIAGTDVPGERIVIQGRVIDGDGAPVDDALLEIWQADAAGKYPTPGAAPARRFHGFGRVPTDNNGAFRFSTIKPGAVPGPGGRRQAPHLVVAVFMRGLLKHLLTRVYFPDEPANADDPILACVPAARRATLVARRPSGSSSALEWNVCLQGADETVFFDID